MKPRGRHNTRQWQVFRLWTVAGNAFPSHSRDSGSKQICPRQYPLRRRVRSGFSPLSLFIPLSPTKDDEQQETN